MDTSDPAKRRITVNGHTYDSTDDLRHHLRSQLEESARPQVEEPAIPLPDHEPRAASPSRPPDAPPPGQVLLNGVPIDLDAPPKRRWWRRR